MVSHDDLHIFSQAPTDATADSMFSLPVLEHQLVMYVTNPETATFSKPFDISSVPVVTREQSLAEDRTKKLTTATPTLKAPSTGPKPAARGSAEAAATATASAQKYAQQLQAIPDFATYGGVLKSSQVVELTESETEYVVTAVKHLFKEHVVLQFDVKNTLPDTVLADVTVVCTPSAADDDEEIDLQEEFTIPAPLLKTDEPGTVYVSFKRPDGQDFVAANFSNVLKFTSKEIDPTTGEPEDSGYEDEYEIEPLDLAGADYIVPAFAGNFDSIFDGIDADEEHEADETLQLSNAKNIAEATELLVKTLAMQPLEGSEIALSTSTHSLKLYGKSVSGGKVAALIRMAYSAKSGVTVKINVRAEEAGLAALVILGIA